MRWVDLDGAVNVRDLGGLATSDGGATRFGQLLRADNLQDLTRKDLDHLIDGFGLRHVIDLRSEAEVRLEGPGPLSERAEVALHHLSLFAEGGQHTDVEADTGPGDAGNGSHDTAVRRALALDDGAGGDTASAVLPWKARQDAVGSQRSLDFYLGYLRDRPDSVVGALRVMAYRDGAVLFHCAAGKDRTGVVAAFALEVAGVTREAIVADYVQTGERLDHILARLRASPTYAADLDTRPPDSHRPRAATMERFLAVVDEQHGGPLGWLARHGWSTDDSTALRTRLVEG